MASKYKGFPKLIFYLLVLSLIILFIRRDEYLENYRELRSAEFDTTAVDTLIEIQVVEEVRESRDLSSGLVAYYPFSGDAKDASRKNNDGEVIGAILTTDRYRLPFNAFKFNGVSDYIKLPKTARLKSMLNTFTATAWISPAIYEGSRGIMAWDGHWSLAIDKLKIVGKICGYPNQMKSVYSGNTLPINEWSFVGISYNGHKIDIYTNGNRVGSVPFRADSLGFKGFRLYSEPVIGHGVGVYPQYFKGNIDELYFYSRALNQTEIKALYNSQRPANS